MPMGAPFLDSPRISSCLPLSPPNSFWSSLSKSPTRGGPAGMLSWKPIPMRVTVALPAPRPTTTLSSETPHRLNSLSP